ncbi:MAG: hypothetical protein IJ593_07080 [Lachnospiraceae bacterium]|nr:hypothetical protein [Lachnospiraceae bacterium]
MKNLSETSKQKHKHKMVEKLVYTTNPYSTQDSYSFGHVNNTVSENINIKNS